MGVRRFGVKLAVLALVAGCMSEVDPLESTLLEAQAELQLPHTVQLRRKTCGSANASYARNVITVCDELWQRRRAMFAKDIHDEATIDRTTIDTMTFTVMHELGHAVFEQRKVPFVGREEDAADEFAATWLIAHGRGHIARAAVEAKWLRWHAFHTYEYWDEHSTAAQRAFAIACLLYGADPKGNADLMKRLDVPAHRQKTCADEYARASASWSRLVPSNGWQRRV